ncbi:MULTISPECIES: alpha/beta hydrolase [Sphingobium]|uniref:Esterase n=1 Tax=Sphingobium chungbukense TaxID=56193 RepID=A0A0M3AMZ8_9SPHN|nr:MULTISPECIES: alpha/beta hydrolase [Sphingobium]KKW91542.1 esterase [Sphingobium chungbukense]PJG46441.1 esterase [Sphingobium sp. LB126]
MAKLFQDVRVDPRIKAVFGDYGEPAGPDMSSREELIEFMNSPEAQEAVAADAAFFASAVSEECAPSQGIVYETRVFTSQPDGNQIKIQYIRPEGAGILPCVYYMHGGGMAYLSAFDPNYRAWGRIMAAQGVAVAMVDFRNSLLPSSAPEIAPFPAGLNDCVAGLKWVHAHAEELQIDPDKIIVAGESGGGNLALATALKLNRDGDIGLIKGVYALCPFIAGQWPHPDHPSSAANEGIFISIGNNRLTLAYGIEAFERQDPLAWPIFASEADLKGLPQTVISVNECDPLHDEGVAFYRKLLAAGVPARCRSLIGTVHAVEILPRCAPDVSANTANDIAYLARTGK